MRGPLRQLIRWLLPALSAPAAPEPEILFTERPFSAPRVAEAGKPLEKDSFWVLKEEVTASMRQLRSLELALASFSSQLPSPPPLHEEEEVIHISLREASESYSSEDILITLRN